MGRVTYRQIAERAGVTESTVSRALSEKKAIREMISKPQREAILSIAREMGYPVRGHNGRGELWHTVGFIVTSIADIFWARVVEGAEHVATAAGWNLILTFSHNNPEIERRALVNLMNRHIDGVIIAGSRESRLHFEKFREKGLPVAMINVQSDEEDHPDKPYMAIGVDDHEGARLATRKLLSLGHRRIGYLGLSIRPGSNNRRKAGYEEALREAGITPEPGLQIIDSRESHDMEIAVQFGRDKAPCLHRSGATAILCYNDMVAIGASQGLQEERIGVPADCSVMGFDDIEPLGYVNPRITTMHQPRFELGQMAMLRLLGKIDSESDTIRQMTADTLLHMQLNSSIQFDSDNDIFLPTLRLGESTAPPKS